MKKTLMPYLKNGLSLKNHLVMAPMTRCRAINNVPNDLMAEYYGQRSGAGLIITEGTSPAPDGLGYSRIPGIFSAAQVDGWKLVTDAVHKNHSRIFLQLMHTGRVSHSENLPEGAKVVGASDVKASGQMYSDGIGMQDYSQPTGLSTEDTYKVIDEYVTAAENAITAGFDGIELHGANGYLIEQFLNPNVNNRTDEFGGSVANRCKFAITIAEKTAAAIGKEKVGVRISPWSGFNDMQPYDSGEVHETYAHLAEEFNRIGIAYIHISANADIPPATIEAIRSNFKGTIIVCNGQTPATAETVLTEGMFDLVAFGRYYLANPDLDKKIAVDAPLTDADFQTFYSPGAQGYTDYPFLNNN